VSGSLGDCAILLVANVVDFASVDEVRLFEVEHSFGLLVEKDQLEFSLDQEDALCEGLQVRGFGPVVPVLDVLILLFLLELLAAQVILDSD